MPHSNTMGIGYAIALLDELKLRGCRAVALEILKSAVLAQQTNNTGSPKCEQCKHYHPTQCSEACQGCSRFHIDRFALRASA
jgi:hypothetical protein